MDTAVDAVVTSPCIQICKLDADNICVGCGRSLDEIATWGAASQSEQQAICQRAAARRQAKQKRHA